MADQEYLKCPKCNAPMVFREGSPDFYGCSRYPECRGTRQLNEAKGKQVYFDVSTGGWGECNRCGANRVIGPMGLCERCNEWFEDQ
ncbi:topoisomerase DNA-binding C4 zinc finger domain-containing protein [Paenibacillus wynnii]|uniref:DNA topoisomerase type IA zn finger domain-containing protein n=1 Tax=Paenibacillus wynnii TaxID=268407 RepID=A0A098MDE0_9BACL|nr:topoisomerase DNA-binding C4 zinc finger domain-containing protein [Paenibacillus wynnii]KGE20073.1 hypothetical protein PWYN_12540 [Paenibacillus wynnii]